MTPYSEKFVLKEEVLLFNDIKRVVENLPDINLGINEKGKKVLLSCHILCRALSEVFSLQYADGFYYPKFDHSWLITKEGHILDVYPVGAIGGPIMVVNPKTDSPAYWLYKEKKLSGNGFDKPWFKDAVCKIKIEILKLL